MHEIFPVSRRKIANCWYIKFIVLYQNMLTLQWKSTLFLNTLRTFCQYLWYVSLSAVYNNAISSLVILRRQFVAIPYTAKVDLDKCMYYIWRKKQTNKEKKQKKKKKKQLAPYCINMSDWLSLSPEHSSKTNENRECMCVRIQSKYCKDFRQAFIKQWNLISRDFRNKMSLWVLGCEGHTTHIDFVTFNIRASLVRRRNNDEIPMERSRKWAYFLNINVINSSSVCPIQRVFKSPFKHFFIGKTLIFGCVYV